MPKLRVLRKHLHWYAAQERQWQADAGCPAFFFELPTGYFYGFPSIDARGVKLAEHSGGELVVDPSDVSRHIDDEDERRVRAFSAECLPTLSGRHLDHAVCMYTMTDDQHFLVDRHPECDKIVFAAGLSGHGFKFATVLGEILAELSIEGHSSLPIDSLRLRRFAV
jgi:glycine/D-amino acid oxidase-like deaminating enzyme